MILFTACSYSCAIDDGEEVVLTGGVSWGSTVTTVTRYNIQGQATHLPSLNTARYHHACGTIKKSDGATVRTTQCEQQMCCIRMSPLSTGSLYPKFQVQTSGIIQKLYETKTNTNTGWFKSVYWLFSEIKPKMCDFARFHCFSSKNGLNCNMTFR